MFEVIPRIPAYYLFRRLGWPRILPLSLTISASFKCNSRCKTCNIYKKKCEELAPEEWETVFRGLGRDLFWVTMSGGEPFLNPALSKIVCSLYDHCHPAVITIPTNGLLRDRIPDVVQKISRHCVKSRIVVNVSLDEIEDRHDSIRGIPGCYNAARDTFLALRALHRANVSLGIHTVISRFNVARIPDIYRHLRKLVPDSYITEIAEEREELSTVGADIVPPYEDYVKAVDFLAAALRKDCFDRVGRITRAFRIEYYGLVKKILKEQRQIIPCYAGFASAQIAPNGDVWMCCVQAKSIGNLRQAGYDFAQVWFSPEAAAMRQSIKEGHCYCPLANAGYTNMLFDPGALSRAGANFANLPA